MTAATPVRSLHSKLAQVMAEAERIPKNGKAPAAMGGYEFVQVGDAADAIRKALAARSVSMIPSVVEVLSESEHATSRGGTMTTQTVRTTWTLTDGESGETATIQSLGTGADAGDKFSPKAQTNAMKYALLMGFLLSTGDDPEASKGSDDRRARQTVLTAGSVPPEPAARPAIESAYDSGLVGVATVGKGDADFELRQTTEDGKDGWRLAFTIVEGRTRVKVIAKDALAEMLAEYRAGVEGQRVTCWGSVDDETFTPAGSKKSVTYQVLNLDRLKVGALDLSAPEHEPTPDEDALVEELGKMAFPVPA